MTRALYSLALLGGLSLLVPTPVAGSGRIVFGGAIVDTGCSVRGDQLACPPGRHPDARLQRFDGAAARTRLRASLFDYAVMREPSRPWRLIEVTYR